VQQGCLLGGWPSAPSLLLSSLRLCSSVCLSPGLASGFPGIASGLVLVLCSPAAALCVAWRGERFLSERHAALPFLLRLAISKSQLILDQSMFVAASGAPSMTERPIEKL